MRSALADGFRFEGVRRGAADDGADRFVWARLDGDQPRGRVLPDLPAGGLTDGVVTVVPVAVEHAQPLWQTFFDPTSVRWAIKPATESFAEFRTGLAEAEGRWLIGSAASCTVLDTATGDVAGDVSVRMMDGLLGRLNLGYAVHPAWRGRGVAGRAAVLLARWAGSLPAVHRVEASANVDNAASLRVLERAGFEREGVLRGLLPSALGPRQDVVLYRWPDERA